ncbi:MAG: DUF2993 domain-containing protein [Corynebacteriales bacterium]|nr:DUF2993 domain-containing protein [Mycobacteriales bacterium]
MTTEHGYPEQPAATPPQSASRPRRRRWWIALGVAVVVMCGCCSFGDRLAANIAEDQLVPVVEDAAAEHELEASETHVELKGFPFLTQVAQREFDGADIKMKNATLQQVPLENVNITLSGVTVPSDLLTGADPHDVTVERVDGVVRIDPKVLAARLPVPDLELRTTNGKLFAQARLEIRGFTGVVEGEVSLRVDNEMIVPNVSQLTSQGGPAPEVATEYINTELERGYALPELPFGLSLTEVAIRGDLIEIRGEGGDTTLAN